jgi:endo-1,4-beta-mannosidase
MLGETIQGFNVPITFFLDAHPCGDAYFGEGNPLVRTYQGHSSIEAELDQIARHHIKRHTIMIDDWKVFGSSKIIEKIREINRDYNIEYREGNYKNDILIASV